MVMMKLCKITNLAKADSVGQFETAIKIGLEDDGQTSQESDTCFGRNSLSEHEMWVSAH
jgi:hypothetical protein